MPIASAYALTSSLNWSLVRYVFAVLISGCMCRCDQVDVAVDGHVIAHIPSFIQLRATSVPHLFLPSEFFIITFFMSREPVASDETAVSSLYFRSKSMNAGTSGSWIIIAAESGTYARYVYHTTEHRFDSKGQDLRSMSLT